LLTPATFPGGGLAAAGRVRGGARRPAAGFTLVELIVVIVLMAIIAAFAAPRFMTRGDLEGPAFAHELAAAARYAQKMAVASGCPVRLVVAGTGYRLLQPQAEPGAACDTVFTRDVLHPGSGLAFAAATPAGTSLGANLTVEFDAHGAPNGGAVIPVGGISVVIAPGSGYVDVQ
jgi:MSHA pilin protein MshC